MALLNDIVEQLTDFTVANNRIYATKNDGSPDLDAYIDIKTHYEEGRTFTGQAHGGSSIESFSASKTFDADDGNNQYMPVTATTTVAITNELPGVYIIELEIDSGASPVITIGASFGTVMDNSAELLDADDDINIITLYVNPNSDNRYSVNTITA